MAFAEKLKELRQQKGMTQSELAKLLKMQRSTLGMYETGKREPNFETLNMFANFFNVDMNTLMDMNNTSNQNPSSPVRSIKIPVLGTVVAIANNMAVYSPHFYSNKDIEELPVRIIGKVVELRGKL